jgi:hypothetical protein
MRSRRNGLARRSVFALLATLLLLLPSSALHAHSAPGVAAIVDEDAHGIYVVRLYEGHAQHARDGWHMFCSSLYQGQGSEISAALPGGGVAIAPTGIWLLQRDGTIGPHPDPQGQGFVTAFARGAGTLYGIRQRSGGYDVIEVTASAVRVLWTDSRYWSDLAVGGTFIQLVRIDGGVIEELQLSLGGKVLSTAQAAVADVQAVNAHIVDDAAYYTVRLGTRVQLGRIQQNAWQVLQMAASSIAGPSRTADGVSFVALDGKLATFDADVLTPLPEMDFVTGLNRLDDHSYACTRTGLRNLSRAGLGEPLFDLSQLLPPDPCIVPENVRVACELEWQHVQVELLGSNIPLAQASALSQCTAGSGGMGATDVADASPDLGGVGGATIGGARVDSGVPALPDGGASVPTLVDSDASMSTSTARGGGCNVAWSAGPPVAEWVVLLLCLYACRRDAKFAAAPPKHG